MGVLEFDRFLNLYCPVLRDEYWSTGPGGYITIINMWPTTTPIMVISRSAAIELNKLMDYLEGPSPNVDKVARVRKFYGVDEPMDLLKVVEDMYELEDSWRRGLMEYILRELMGASEEEIRDRIAKDLPFIDRLPNILKRIN